VQRIQGFVVTAAGVPAAGCAIAVYDTGTANLSTIYADDLQIPTPKANPTVADANGYFFFYAAGAKRYDVAASGGGLGAALTVLADVPAGLGDGAVAAYTAGTLPTTAVQHAGRLARQTDGRGGLFVDDGTGWKSVLDYGLDSKATADLPAAGTAGRLRRLTDSYQGLVVDDGAAWQGVLGYGIPSSTFAALPAAALAGRLRRVTDSKRGLWMDTGSAWLGLSGEVVNVVEFGATRDGATNDAPAIQAAIDALAAAGGTVVFPPGSYAIAVPLKLRDKVTLRGSGGVTILAGAGWAGDCLVQAYRRDDNTAANEDKIRIENLRLQAPAAPPAAFAGLDLTGASDSVVIGVLLIGPGTSLTGTALRLSNRNPTASSAKRCQNNFFAGVAAFSWPTFLTVEQTVADYADHNTLIGFEGSGCRIGIELTNLSAGSARLLLLGGQLIGDNDAASKVISRGATPLPKRLSFLQVAAANFSITTDYAGESFQSGPLVLGASGTSNTSPVAQSSALGQDFTGSAYLKLTAGTALAAGVNTFTYTLPNPPSGVAFSCVLVSGIPTTPISMQASLSGATLTVVVVAAAAVVLPSDFVYRVIQIAP
jgi:hypothetical protein